MTTDKNGKEFLPGLTVQHETHGQFVIRLVDATRATCFSDASKTKVYIFPQSMLTVVETVRVERTYTQQEYDDVVRDAFNDGFGCGVNSIKH